jgi:O-antigen/teichoic acid export membrane protein
LPRSTGAVAAPSNIGRSSFRRNASANVLAYLIPTVIAFFLSPFQIHMLGDARYGVWAVISELSGYYGLFDLGVRGTVGYYIARHYADGDWDHLHRVVNLAFWYLTTVAVIVMAVGMTIALNLPSLFRIGTASPSEVRIAAVLITIAVALNLPGSISASFLNGFRRIDLMVGVELAVRTVASAAIFLLLYFGYGLIAIAAVQGAAGILIRAIQYGIVRRMGVSIPLWPVHREWVTFKDLFKISSANVIIDASGTIINQAQVVLVASLMSTVWVTYFVTGRQLSFYYNIFVLTIAQALTTTFTFHYASGNVADVKRLYIRGARLTGSLAVFGAVSIIAFGHFFLRLWIGDKYVSGDIFYRSDTVLVLMMLATLPRTFHAITVQLLIATRKLRFFTILRVAEAVSSLVLSVVLMRPFGLAGVALATTISMSCSHVLLGGYTLRAFGIPFSQYWSSVLMPSLLASALPGVCAAAFVVGLPPRSWKLLMGEAAVVTAAFAASHWIFALTPAERMEMRGHAGSMLARLGLRRASGDR